MKNAYAEADLGGPSERPKDFEDGLNILKRYAHPAVAAWFGNKIKESMPAVPVVEFMTEITGLGQDSLWILRAPIPVYVTDCGGHFTASFTEPTPIAHRHGHTAALAIAALQLSLRHECDRYAEEILGGLPHRLGLSDTLARWVRLRDDPWPWVVYINDLNDSSWRFRQGCGLHVSVRRPAPRVWTLTCAALPGFDLAQEDVVVLLDSFRWYLREWSAQVLHLPPEHLLPMCQRWFNLLRPLVYDEDREEDDGDDSEEDAVPDPGASDDDLLGFGEDSEV